VPQALLPTCGNETV